MAVSGGLLYWGLVGPAMTAVRSDAPAPGLPPALEQALSASPALLPASPAPLPELAALDHLGQDFRFQPVPAITPPVQPARAAGDATAPVMAAAEPEAVPADHGPERADDPQHDVAVAATALTDAGEADQEQAGEGGSEHAGATETGAETVTAATLPTMGDFEAPGETLALMTAALDRAAPAAESMMATVLETSLLPPPRPRSKPLDKAARMAVAMARDANLREALGLEEGHARPLVVTKGDTLMTLLMRAGASRVQALQAAASVRGMWSPHRLRPGQEVVLLQDAQAEFLGFAVDAGPAERIAVKHDAAKEQYVASRVKRPVTRVLRRKGAVIDASMESAARRQRIPQELLPVMVAAFSYEIDFQRQIHPGDRFEVIYEELRNDAGERVGTGDIIKATLQAGGERVTIYNYTTGDGEQDFYHPNGHSVRKALLRTPINGARISSGYGMRRHPILGYSRMHTGVDFAARTGTPIKAAGDGVIDYRGRRGGYGNYIRIQHNNDKYQTAYAHLSRYGRYQKGQRVEQGDIIGYVGTTGRSTGPHLHYEVLVNGRHVNPMKVRFPSGRQLKGTELARFRKHRQTMETRIAELPRPVQLAQR